ncbi:MAG: terminase [Carnobacterium sp.]|uniref:terminase n=1 Tax=Carnobacterium sp. TaxID=48221 RepID=UPI002FCA6685
MSEKYIDFMVHEAPVEFLEGTTASGKTTTGVPKFMFKVAQSPKKLHILSGLDLGTIEKNIITKDNGILDIFGSTIDYNPDGKGKIKLPHIIYHVDANKAHDKIIYVLGYDNKARWKKALGGQYGCLYIDEANIADIDFVREAAMRSDYLIGTLNPDDPNIRIFDEYVNCCRPIEKYKNDVPKEIMEMIKRIPAKPNWTYWFFTFDDNAGLTKEKKDRIIENVPPGTKIYKNKILGLRGRATGLVFSNFNTNKHTIKKYEAKQFKYRYFSCGVDTAYSSDSPDTISFIFIGITMCGKCVVLDEEVTNNADLTEPLAPSDVIKHLVEFLEWNRKEWGFAKNVYIDSADQATIKESHKYKRNNACIYTFNGAWKSKMKVIDRIHAQLGYIHEGEYLVMEHCINHIIELESYCWKEDKYEPEDRNDHTINASQYGWIPFNKFIGGKDGTTTKDKDGNY